MPRLTVKPTMEKPGLAPPGNSERDGGWMELGCVGGGVGGRVA